MTPPWIGQAGENAPPDTGPAAVLSCPVPAPSITTLARRPDFLRAASARRQGTGSFMLQARLRQPDEPARGIRIGFTCSKKVGNAVLRNRAKRRLRALARAVLPRLGQDGWDYVLVGRPEATVSRDFSTMLSDLERALASVHAPSTRRPDAAGR